MKLAPIQLENYFIKSLRFDLRAGFDSRESVDDEVALPEFNVNANVTQDTDDLRRCRCELSIELTDDPNDKFPYTFAITLIGVFRVSSKYPEAGLDLLLKVNAPSIMYSAAREIALGISGRGGYPPVLLPSVSFVPPLEDPSARQLETAKTAPTSTHISTSKKTSVKKTRAKVSRKASEE